MSKILIAFLLAAGCVFGQGTTKITAGDGQAGDSFGRRVSLSGENALISSAGDPTTTYNTQVVYSFRRFGDQWTELNQISPDSGVWTSFEELKLDLDGETAIVAGLHFDTATQDLDHYLPFIFQYDGLTWEQVTRLLPQNVSEEQFTTSAVAISDNYAIVGAWISGNGIADWSQAYSFSFNGTNWVEGGLLIPTGASVNERFGFSLDISGDSVVVVGAPVNGIELGAIYVFRRSGNQWLQEARLTGAESSSGDWFGYSVATNGDIVLAGAYADSGFAGAVYVFRQSGGNWIQETKLKADDGQAGDIFGIDVALSDAGAVVGASGNDDRGQGAGSAYFFTSDGNTWKQQNKLLPDSLMAGDAFAINLSASENFALISAQGDDDLGDNAGAAYLFDLIPFEITNPAEDDLWIRAEAETIRWTAPDHVEDIDIFFSADSGVNFETIIFDHPADSGQYVWQVPDTLSRKCIIEISNSLNPDEAIQSRRFKIKDYELTRVDANDNYEVFEVKKHGWQFSNSFPNIWPQSWWQQFDYANGLDPFTNNFYPPNWLGPDVYASPPVFPSWEAFVRAYGTEQTYWGSVALGIYRPSAVQKWKNWRGNSIWRGSCTGFVISSLQAFDDIGIFQSNYAEIPSFLELNDLPINAAIRKVINQLQIHQSGKQHRAFFNTQLVWSPRQTVDEISDMLQADHPSGRYLYIKRFDKSAAHAVIPYRILPFPNDSVAVFIYDPNRPGDDQRFIMVDTVANSWRYVQNPNYRGNNRFLLLGWGDRFYDPPILQANGSSNTGSADPGINKSSNNSNLEFFHTAQAAVTFTNSSGFTAGFADSSDFSEIEGAVPIIPPTGYYHPPIGWQLPQDSYQIRLESFGDSLSYLSFVSDSLIYSYSRQDAVNGEQDDLIFDNGLTICNNNQQMRMIHQETILISTEFERQITFLNVPLFGGDSLHVTKASERDITFTNDGTDKTYDIVLRQVSGTSEAEFKSVSIELEANASHLLQPGWEDLANQPLKILVDRGNNGSVDDTLFIDNIVSLSDTGEESLPVRYALHQNYPNPFNPETTIQFALPTTAQIDLVVYDLRGREVAHLISGQRRTAGQHSVTWDGRSDAGIPVASGMYFYRLRAENEFVATKKMLLIR